MSFIGIRIRKFLGSLQFFWRAGAHVAQLVERVLGKDEVISSTLIMGSIQAKTEMLKTETLK